MIEEINEGNLYALTKLMLELWPDCSFKEEYENCENILAAPEETCYLYKAEDRYIAFVQLSIRKEYVEGARGLPVAYVEGIFVDDEFRKQKIGKQLLDTAANWAKEKDCNQLASDAEIDNTTSINFHKKCGFKEVSRMVCFLKDLP